MTLAVLDVDQDTLAEFHPARSKGNIATAEDIHNGHISLSNTLKDNTTNRRLVATGPDTSHGYHHHSSASANDLSKVPTHKHHQTDLDRSNAYRPATFKTCLSTHPADNLNQTNSSIANDTTPEMIENGELYLGPHASIVVREWKLLQNTRTSRTPVHVDTDYLGLARVTAVSK